MCVVPRPSRFLSSLLLLPSPPSVPTRPHNRRRRRRRSRLRQTVITIIRFQGRPGDETATAFCVPILERVLERYPAGLARKDAVADVSARVPASEGTGTATPPPDAQVYELVALVLTRTREMAADIAVSPLAGYPGAPHKVLLPLDHTR